MQRTGNGLMGVGFLGALVAGALLFVGPKDQAGHVFWWWYALTGASVLLWLVGQGVARRSGLPNIRYMPKGEVVVLTRQEVRSANQNLADKAACSACKSRDLLWYQYRSKSLDPEAAVYVRCQNCGHDDYTQL